MIYLLDTNTVVDLMRGLKLTDPKTVRQRKAHATGEETLQRARAQGMAGHDVALSAITVAELEFGAQKSGEYQREMEVVHRVLTPFTLLNFDADQCAARYGAIRYALENAGCAIGSLDTLIAAHALSISATLVTSNTKEFSRVPELNLENWAVA